MRVIRVQMEAGRPIRVFLSFISEGVIQDLIKHLPSMSDLSCMFDVCENHFFFLGKEKADKFLPSFSLKPSQTAAEAFIL